MLDGYRTAGNFEKLDLYFKKFNSYNLSPDAYTLSIKVRTSNSTFEVLDLISLAEKTNNLHAPFLRCCIETLGKITAPELAYEVAIQYLPDQERINQSKSSGDSLIVALLSADQPSAPILINNTQYDSTFTFCIHLVFNSLIDFGPKGFNTLISHIKKIRQVSQLYNIEDMKRNEINSLNLLRDKLWQYVLKRNIINFSNINGRICDALLRSYSYDINECISFWKNELLVLAKAVKENRSVNEYKELVEKSFEALMFVSGQSMRPDIALEIAINARKQNWNLGQREKLSAAYYRGKLQAYRSSKNVLDKIIIDGLENSLEGELGILFPSNRNKNGLKKIRLKW